jgi:hypothetical protein
MPLPTAPFDATKSLYAGLSVILLKLSASRVTGATGAEATDTISAAAHPFQDGDRVIYESGTGGTGLTAGNHYYVRDRAAGTFKLALTKGGTAVDFSSALSAASFVKAAVFESRMLDLPNEQEVATLELPDSKGVLRKVREVLKKEGESFAFESPEPRRLIEIFNGALSGRVTAEATLWCPDVDDASGKCALKSEDGFACAVSRDGGMKVGDGDFTKATLKIVSNKQGAITWTVDAAIS